MIPIADLIKTTPTACCLPFMQLRVHTADQAVLPCCVYDGSIDAQNDTLPVVWFGKQMNSLRSDMISGNIVNECNRCNSPSDGRSYRDFKNDRFSNMVERNDVMTEVEKYPTVMDISTGSTCNLACRMCSANVSSKIESIATPKMREFVGHSKDRTDFIKLIGDPVIFLDTQYLLITGGEPFLEKNTQLLLDMVKEHAPKLHKVHLSTNMSVVNRRMLDSLAGLGCKVSISISIDGDKQTHEYIRAYSDYDLMKKNTQVIATDYPHVFTFEVNTTVSAMNAFRTARTLQSIKTFEEDCGIKFDHMLVAPVQEPHNHPGVLPTHTKEIVRSVNRQITEEETTIPGSELLAETALSMVDANHQIHFGKFVALMREFDMITGKNKEESLPEIFNREGSRFTEKPD